MASSESPADSLLSPRTRRWIAPLLVLVGVQFWLVFGGGDYSISLPRWLPLIAAFLTCTILFVDRIRHPSRRAAMITAIALSLIAAIYFPLVGLQQGRNFLPKWQDEFSFLIQIRALSRERLWMPAHALGDFFDSFQLIVDPVYASMYFPGASLLYVPAAWFGLPFWVVSSAICGLCVGLMYLIVTELIDGAAGALAAVMMLGLSMLRQHALMVTAQPAILLMGLAMFYCWLRWRRNQSRGWTVAIGVIAGWAAITRPLDALIFAAPIGIAMLLQRRSWSTLACLVAGAAPFLVLQIIFNIGVTGSWHRTPFQLYAQRNYPGTGLGFPAFDPARRPISQLPQKQKFHDLWTIPAIERHQPGNIVRNWMHDDLKTLCVNTLPHPFMLLLFPAGILGLTCRRRIALWLTLPLFVILYSLYTWFQPHYAIIVVPAMLLTVLLGARQFETIWPPARRAIAWGLYFAIILLSLNFMNAIDEPFDPPEFRQIDRMLAKLDRKPAVVLFRFPPEGNPHVEPVYNIDAAWPDDAAIIRAHDLGSRNNEIFRYYAQRQPQRAFYLYDRGDGSLHYLGLAKDLANAD